MISVLTEELVRRGHEVTLFASGDSRTAARLVPIVDRAIWRNDRYQLHEPFVAIALDEVYSRAHEFDVIHNHDQLSALALARLHPEVPTVTTLHGRLDLPEYQVLFEHFSEHPLVSISDAQREPLPRANWQATVHHGVRVEACPFQPQPEGYVAFVGRIAQDKGLDAAIRVARRGGLSLKIAARMPLNQPANPEAKRDWRYYQEVVKPLLAGPDVEYVGELEDSQKAALVGKAAACLFPIRWPEPFGLVMIEALACGTPVIALRRGSTPEIVQDGVTGFLADDEDGLVRALGRLDEIDRRACRAAAETRFSAAAMADGYERVYRHLGGMACADPGTEAA